MKTIGINLIAFHNNNIVGPGKFIQRLLTELANHDLSNYKFIFYIQEHLTPSVFGITPSLNHEIIRVPRLHGRIIRILFEQTIFYFYLKKCDVLFSPSLSMPFFGQWKKVITLHDMLPFIFKKKHNWYRRLYITSFTKFTIHIVDHIITVSENSKRDIINLLNVVPSKVSIIYNFITNDDPVIRNQIPQDNIINTIEGPLKLQEPFFCTISSLHPGKNIAGLIHGFNIFHNTHNNFHLYIIGKKAWDYELFFDTVTQYGLEDFIHFTGYLDDENLDKAYSVCYGVVYVSFFEGFGIPPLEGFYHNKSCIVSNTTSLPEVVGNAGIYIDPYSIESIAQGLTRFIKEKDICENHISEQIAKFTPSKQAQTFLRTLENVTLGN